MTSWSSGLRRQLKALIREAMGSNPTDVIKIPKTLKPKNSKTQRPNILNHISYVLTYLPT